MDSNVLENALKQIQNWFVNGEFDKVVRGCKEILNVAPNNSIAQDLLKKAEESIQAAPAPPAFASVQGPSTAPMGAPATYEDIPTPPAMEPEPTASTPAPPMPEPLPEAPMPEPVPFTPEEAIPMPMPDEEEHHKLHSLLINLAILIGIIVIGFGLVLGYHAFFGDKDDALPPATTETGPQAPEVAPDGKPGTEPSENADGEATDDDNTMTEGDATSETPETPTETLTPEQAHNAQRNNDLVMMENALIRYYDEFKRYPNADALETELVQGGYLEALPKPPTADEAYMYAVYSTPVGPNQQFVLSAEFKEGSSTTIWTTGANIQDYPDFRDDSKPNVLAITNPDANQAETEVTPTPAPETPINPADIRVPRTPRPPRAS